MFVEEYHQQYLSSDKNPNGYCGVDGTGVVCPVGVVKLDGSEQPAISPRTTTSSTCRTARTRTATAASTAQALSARLVSLAPSEWNGLAPEREGAPSGY
jgi:hypothetical protein